MKKFITLMLASLVCFSLVACGEKPAPESKLVIYSPNSDGEINAIIPAFEAATGIKVEMQSMGTGDCLARIEAEIENPQADVQWGGMNLGNYTRNPDLWEEYTSPNDTNLPESFQSYNGHYSSYTLSGSAALLINLDVFAELGLNPDDFTGYESLLWPELKGHIAMGDPVASSSAWAELTNMLLVMGDEAYDEKAWDFVEQFIAQLDGNIISSSSQIYKGTADGEYAVGVSYEDPCISLLVDGATNIRVIYPEEGAVWLPAGVAIVKGAPNMENAKKFVDFLLTEEAQRLLAETTTRPAMTDIANTSEFMKPFSEINQVFEDIPFVAENKTDWQTRWTDLFTK